MCPQSSAAPAALFSAYTFSTMTSWKGWCYRIVAVSELVLYISLSVSSQQLNSTQLQSNSSINLFIIVIYHPPGQLGNFLEDIDGLLSLLHTENTPVILLKDFKHSLDRLQISWLLPLLYLFSLILNNCSPTKEGMPWTWLQQCLTNYPTSDYYLLSFTIHLT